IFFTHGSTLNSFSKRQVVVNIWHGLCFKPVGILIGNKGIKADLTVSTSEFTKPMFMKSFGVSYEKVIGSGYPRNDILIREKPNAALYRQKLNLGHFEKVIIWLPTYRKAVIGEIRNDGTEAGNPFYIRDFNLSRFNDLLSSHNAVCFVKPHPMAPQYESQEKQSNVVFI